MAILPVNSDFEVIFKDTHLNLLKKILLFQRHFDSINDHGQGKDEFMTKLQKLKVNQ